LTSGTLTFTADSTTDVTDLPANLTVNGSAAVIFNTKQHLAGLTLKNGATASVAMSSGDTTGTANPNHVVLVTSSISVDGSSKLDMADNDLIIHYGTTANAQAALPTVLALLQSGRGSIGGAGTGAWNGTTGITSSAAQEVYTAKAQEITALGYAVNSSASGPGDLTTGAFSTFDGQSVGSGDMVFKYTHMADGDLSGQSDLDAVSVLGTNYLKTGPKYWSQGDFNYDNTVNITDVTLLSTSYLKTNTTIAPSLAPAFVPTSGPIAAGGLIAGAEESQHRHGLFSHKSIDAGDVGELLLSDRATR
jgi:hypothetical protein